MNSGKLAKRQQNIASTAAHSTKTSTPLETSNLNNIRSQSYGTGPSESIVICADARINNVVSNKLGGLTRHFSISQTMGGEFSCYPPYLMLIECPYYTDVLVECLASWKKVWDDNTGASLARYVALLLGLK